MSELKLETHEDRTQFQPGQFIEGLAGWEMNEPPEKVELCLFWYTSGKGDRDVGVAERKTFDDPAAVDAQLFRFEAPNGPYSYAGRILSINWAIELLVEPGHHTQRVELTITPSGEAVQPSDTEGNELAASDNLLNRFKRKLQQQ